MKAEMNSRFNVNTAYRENNSDTDIRTALVFSPIVIPHFLADFYLRVLLKPSRKKVTISVKHVLKIQNSSIELLSSHLSDSNPLFFLLYR